MIESVIRQFERIINIAKIKLTRRQFILFASILVALTSSLAAIILKTFVHEIFEFVTHNRVSNYRFFYLLLPAIGILLTVLLVNRLYGGKLRKGLGQIHYAIAKKSSYIPKRSMLDQILTSSLTVGFGGSTGLEAPIVVTGAAVGSNFARTYRLNYNERTLLLACGISAGIACAFNAPIAGVLFALEVLVVDIGISAFTPLIIAGAVGTLMSKIILNQNILLNFKLKENFDYFNVPFYIVLGVLAGLISVYHSRIFFKIENGLAIGIKNKYARIFFSGLLLAGLISVFPSLFGEGFQSIKYLAEQRPTELFNNSIIEYLGKNEIVILLFVGVLIFLKTIATALTIGGGGNGGNFAPSLYIGAYLGFFLSRLMNFLKISDLNESNFTLVGMAGILSGLYHAPLTSIFLIAEITNGYALIVPLMIVASISYAVSRHFEKYSMDARSLSVRGQMFTDDKDYNVLTTIEVSDFLDRDRATLSPYDTAEDLIDILSKTKDSMFAVIDKNDHLLGLIAVDEIRDKIFTKEQHENLLIKDLMRAPDAVISIDENMNEVMRIFDETQTWILPVESEGKFIGFILKTAIFSGYRERLKGSTIK